MPVATCEWTGDYRRLGIVILSPDGKFWNAAHSSSDPTASGWEAPFDPARHLIPYPRWAGAADPSGLFTDLQCWPVPQPVPACSGGAAVAVFVLDNSGQPIQRLALFSEDTAPAYPIPTVIVQSRG